MSTAASAEARLRSERDRFVAFAFCGNDMLVELDPRGAVQLALGATEFLTGRDAPNLIGARFADLFVAQDRAGLAETVATAVQSGRRFENVHAAFQTSTRGPVGVEMTGFAMPQFNGHCLIALRRARNAPPPADPSALVAAAASSDQLAIMRKIIAERSFDIAFQPVASLETPGIHHMEALLRVRPALLEMSTYKFIQLAERNGLIAEMDLAMCEATVRRLLEVAERGRPISVAVNVSGTSIESPEFAKRRRAS